MIQARFLLVVTLAASALVVGDASARRLHFPVTVSVSGPGHVTGSGSGGSIDCPPSCSAMIQQQTTITLFASADPGASFDGWGGGCSGQGTCTLFVDGDKSVSASFSESSSPPPPSPPPPPPSFTLTVRKLGAGSGYVGGSGGIDCGPTCSVTLVEGTQVTLVAAPSPGSGFAGWGGACHGRAQCTLTITGDATATASFDDRAPPVASALRSSGRLGARVALRYRAWDASGRVRVQLTVRSGTRLLAALTVPMATVTYRHVYTVAWSAPRSRPARPLASCVVATDPSGNRSARSCAPLVLRRR